MGGPLWLERAEWLLLGGGQGQENKSCFQRGLDRSLICLCRKPVLVLGQMSKSKEALWKGSLFYMAMIIMDPGLESRHRLVDC